MPENHCKSLKTNEVQAAIDPDADAEAEALENNDGRNDETSINVDSKSTPDSEDDDMIAQNGTKPTVLEELNALSNRILSLEKLFEAKILRTGNEEKVIDQMHRELQKYKEDMYSQLVRPILLDMIEMRNSILRVAKAHSNKSETDQNIPLKTFSLYAYDIQEILEKNNVEIFKSEEKSDFTPVRQRAIKKIITDDQSLHGKVAESSSDGYHYNGKTISAEKISIYYYEPSQVQKTKNNDLKEEVQNG